MFFCPFATPTGVMGQLKGPKKLAKNGVLPKDFPIFPLYHIENLGSTLHQVFPKRSGSRASHGEK